MHPLLRNTASLFSGELFARAIGFIATAYLARTLGAGSYGSYAFVFSLFTYLLLITNAGFDTIGAREVARNVFPPSAIVSALMLLRVCIACFVIAVLFIACSYAVHDTVLRTLLFRQSLALLPTALLLAFYLQGRERMAALGWSRVLQSAVFFALVVFAVRSPQDLFRVPYFFVIGSAAATIFTLLLYASRERPVLVNFNAGIAGELIRSAAPAGLSALLVQVYYNLDTVILGFLATPEQVGLYAAAYKIVLLLAAAPGLLFTVFLPSLARQGAPVITKRYITFTCVLILAGLPVAACGYFWAGGVMTLMFGAAYAGGTQALQILCSASAFIFINVALANPLLAWKQEKRYLRVVAAGAVINVALNIALIPRFGIAGAAVATLCAEVAVFAASLRSFAILRGAASYFLELFTRGAAGIIPAFSVSFVMLQIGVASPLTAGALCLVLYAAALSLQRNGFRALTAHSADEGAAHV